MINDQNKNDLIIYMCSAVLKKNSDSRTQKQNSDNKTLTKKNSSSMCMLSRQNKVQKQKLVCLDKNKASISPMTSGKEKLNQVLKKLHKLKKNYISEADF